MKKIIFTIIGISLIVTAVAATMGHSGHTLYHAHTLETPKIICGVTTIKIKISNPATPKARVPLLKIPITVIVTNLESPSATVEMSIYGPDDKFPSPDRQLKKYRVKPKNRILKVKIRGLPYGEYAIALYQDLKNDGKIDKNFLGIPKDPYGFSNNYKPILSAPSFNDCKFIYSAKSNTVHIALIK
jgi:uncharacterized protein (DUF2141 family)